MPGTQYRNDVLRKSESLRKLVRLEPIGAKDLGGAEFKLGVGFNRYSVIVDVQRRLAIGYRRRWTHIGPSICRAAL